MSFLSRTLGAVLLSTVFSSSCATMGMHISVGGSSKNPDLFQDRDALMSRVDHLKNAMEANSISKEAAFGMLGISPERFELLGYKDAMTIVYGGAEPHPQNAADMDSIAGKLKSMQVYRLQGQDTEDRVGALAGLGLETKRQGFMQEISLVFENDRLINVILAGKPVINEAERDYIWQVPQHVIEHPPAPPIF